MWKFTATTTHGKTLHYSATSRDRARTKRATIAATPFIASTSTPYRRIGLTLEKAPTNA